jgi:CTP synthase (UTP-ammonia lyase)
LKHCATSDGRTPGNLKATFAKHKSDYNNRVADAVRIGILGDYDSGSPTLPAIERSIQHASTQLHFRAEATWLATDSLACSDVDPILQAFDGLWAAPGSPYKSFAGMLRGIEFARRRDWPFVGT